MDALGQRRDACGFFLADNPHRAQLEAGFGPSVPDPAFVPPDLDFLFLLFTNRCGSNYLAQALASSGWFNEAGEFFNADVIMLHSRQNGLRSVQEYFGFLPHLVAANGWLVAKLGPENIDVLDEAGILQAVHARSRFILLERQDRLGQAISRVIASQDLRWTSEHARQVSEADLIYSRVRIDEELARIEQGNGFLYRFLSTSGIAPLHFAYEALTERPQAHLDEVAQWLGVPGLGFDPARIRISRQAGPTSAVWRRRYLAGGRGQGRRAKHAGA